MLRLWGHAVVAATVLLFGCSRDWEEFETAGDAAARGGSGGAEQSAGSGGMEPVGGSGGMIPVGGSGGTAGAAPVGGSAGVEPVGGSGGVEPVGGSGGMEPVGGSSGAPPAGGSGGTTPTGGTGGAPPGTGGTSLGGAGSGGQNVGGCDNGTTDGYESDTDCGGPECPPCPDGNICRDDSDCLSNRCEAGICTAASCSDNRLNAEETDVDCGGPTCNGCEAGEGCELARDCAAGPNAVAACTNGVCTLTCEAGWDDCDPGAQGCETNVLSDPANCGACGVVCTGDHATPSCAAGVCSLACDSGWEDCDADPANGCEADTSSDPNHCGACNDPCADPNACFAGRCCVGLEQGATIDVSVGTCFRIKPDRCDCDLVLQMDGGTGSVTVRIEWDSGGSLTQTWDNPGAQVTVSPVSAFAAVVTSVDSPGERSFNWWPSGCAGDPVACFDATE